MGTNLSFLTLWSCGNNYSSISSRFLSNAIFFSLKYWLNSRSSITSNSVSSKITAVADRPLPWFPLSNFSAWKHLSPKNSPDSETLMALPYLWMASCSTKLLFSYAAAFCASGSFILTSTGNSGFFSLVKKSSSSWLRPTFESLFSLMVISLIEDLLFAAPEFSQVGLPNSKNGSSVSKFVRNSCAFVKRIVLPDKIK